ncbi:MAG: YCII-related domain-containing protein [Candidatus Tokpelaia hoelldobleri]|uniref:YCII-related domain-containing protein n=1 Tax=Candidatus Tokpelaia hoelldobleri TaxID=1902579 RepID=A0A1U9JWP7_9HYPH|nr:MAG: YCII-related domain-containing protein [Candidatus Tokpelaia hoelldoblerii]
MLFAILCNDKSGCLALRQATRPEHLDWLKGLGDTLKFAGPFLDETGAANGSLLVIEAENHAAAVALAAQDPYALAGLFASGTVRPWSWTVNNPVQR